MEVTDLENILNYLGIEYLKVMGDELRFLCPWHKESEPSCYFSSTKKVFHCLGCHKRGTLITFLRDYNKWTLTQTMDFLLKINGIKDAEIEFLVLTELDKETRHAVKRLDRIQNGHKLEEIDDEFLQLYRMNNIPYLASRGFTEETIDYFELGFNDSNDGNYKNRVFIPIYDEEYRLCGFSTRRTDAETFGKYMHMANLDKNSLLYNLYNAKKYIPEKPLMLVEGFSDVWMAHQNGYPCVAAVMGKSLSDAQEDLALQYAYEFIIAFDNDINGSGQEGAEQAIDRLKKFAKVYYLKLPEGRDVGSLSKDELKECFSKMKRCN
jgi:DNA primase